MASPLTLSLISIIFTNLLLFVASSSHDHGYDNFHECITDQFQSSNSANDVIHTPKNATYSSLLLSQNLRPASTRPVTPDLIVTPNHVSEIQAAIFCSRKLGLHIRVKSGGHDYEGLSYTSDGTPFIVVDMRNFNSVTVDDKEKTAWVQVGATLGRLYYAISRKSKTLAFTAGVCPTVGVGGHFSGGGYGMMSRKHSIAADHIIDAKLINADGEILDRRTMGEDLFWAMRGGGGTSFGIVLEYKVTLDTVPETVTVFNVTRRLEENATDLVYKWQNVAHEVDENLLMRLFLNSDISPTTGNRTVAASFTSMYLGPAQDLLPIMEQQFPELGLTREDCTETSWIESVLFFALIENQTIDILQSRTPQGGFGSLYFKGKSDYVSSPITMNGLREIWSFLLDELHYEVQFSPYGGAINGYSESETPFPHRRGNMFMIHYVVGSSSPSSSQDHESQAHIDWIRRLYSYMARHVTKNPRAAYYNYRDLDIGSNNMEGNTSYEEASGWGMSYFKGNFKRLVDVKTKVDPSNFFRNEQSIPPLVS